MNIGMKIAAARKAKDWSQEDLGWRLGVSTQAVSKWESGKCEPDKEHLVRLSGLLGLSLDDMLSNVPSPGFEPGSPYFNPEHMYTYVKAKAQAAGLTQTLAALPLMREKHAGAERAGSDVPYYVHPLTMACHALAMGLHDDDVLAAVLAHDMVEDTQALVSDLPANERVREAVRVVSKCEYNRSSQDWERTYFEEIGKNPLACLVKCLDRVNNLAGMADAFTRTGMVKYTKETDQYYPALLEVIRKVPEWTDAWWLLRYQMMTLTETFKRLL